MDQLHWLEWYPVSQHWWHITSGKAAWVMLYSGPTWWGNIWHLSWKCAGPPKKIWTEPCQKETAALPGGKGFQERGRVTASEREREKTVYSTVQFFWRTIMSAVVFVGSLTQEECPVEYNPRSHNSSATGSDSLFFRVYLIMPLLFIKKAAE